MSLAQACFRRGLVPQRLLVQSCFLGGCSLVLAAEEVSGSGLLWQRSLARAWSCGCPCLGPAPMKVTGLGLLLWRQIPWACSCGSHWPGPDPAEVLAWAWSHKGCCSGLLPQTAPGEVAPYSILNLKKAGYGAISLLSCGISNTKGQL